MIVSSEIHVKIIYSLPCPGASETAFEIQNYQKLKRMKIKIGEEEKKGLGTKKKKMG